MRNKMDEMRRVNKKLSKKKDVIDDKRKERNKARNVQCLACKKCKLPNFEIKNLISGRWSRSQGLYRK